MHKPTLRSGLALLAITVASLASHAAHAAYVLTEIARPGAASTALWDINNAGVMVGSSTAGTVANDFSTGFVFDGTGYTSLVGPAGAVSSSALGISDGGTVVGNYNTVASTDAGGNITLGASIGFIYAGGSYTSFSVAGAMDTFLRGISPDGRYLSGYYSTATQSGVGFVYDTSTATRTDVSEADSVLTIPQGINSHGVVVGSDIRSATLPGFLYDIGTATRTDVSIPGAFRTALRSIADDGELAGWFTDAGGQHGFIGSLGSFEQIDFAGATSTFVEGSNNARFLVGEFFAADGSIHAFIATPVAAPGTLALMALALGALASTRRRLGAV